MRSGWICINIFIIETYREKVWLGAENVHLRLRFTWELLEHCIFRYVFDLHSLTV